MILGAAASAGLREKIRALRWLKKDSLKTPARVLRPSGCGGFKRPTPGLPRRSRKIILSFETLNGRELPFQQHANVAHEFTGTERLGSIEQNPEFLSGIKLAGVIRPSQDHNRDFGRAGVCLQPLAEFNPG